MSTQGPGGDPGGATPPWGTAGSAAGGGTPGRGAEGPGSSGGTGAAERAGSSPEAVQVFNDRYELVRHIARGGMAQVYLAKDLLLDRPVALKVLFPELSVDRAFVERFRREAQAAANLSHPNIVSVYDWGEGERTYFIVMEYIDGRTLAQLIRQGPLDAQQAASIAADVAAALSFAHRKGVIHRDVKPGNVLLDRSGQVKVADFGIARAIGTQEGLTQTGAVMGTATYFSPEQAQGHRVDARSDVYSLGVVLYEMVTGQAPFAGDNAVTIAYKHVREDAVRPTDVNRAVPPPLEAIILKAMAKDPGHRYQSAGDLRDDLLRYVNGSAVLAEPPPPTTVMGATRVQSGATRIQPPLIDEYEEERRRTGWYIAALLAMLAVLAVLLFLLGRQLGLFTKSSSGTVAIPADIIGKPVNDATSELQTLGLKAQRTAPQGNVVSATPAVGTTVKKGSTVLLTVNTPPVMVSVPSVVGLSQAAATTMLRQAGFTVSAQQQNSDTAALGNVIDQNPPGGAQLAKGQPVTIVVSLGQAQITIPNEANKDPATAGNDLGSQSLKTRQASEPSSSIQAGLVTRTDPPAGTQVAKGATVVIYVSSGPQQVTIPNTVGQPVAQAKAQLTAAGFLVSVTTVPTSDPTKVGLVMSQTPAGGQAVKGSPVAITVWAMPPTTTTSSVTSSTTHP